MAIFFYPFTIVILNSLFSTCFCAPLELPTRNQIMAGADVLDQTIKFMLPTPTHQTTDWEAMEERGVCPLIRIYGYFKSTENLTEYSYQSNVSVIIFLAKNLAETFCEYMKNESCNSDRNCSMNCSISSISELCLQANLFGKKIREYRIAMIGTASIEPKPQQAPYEAYETWLNRIPSSEYTDAVVTNVEKVLKDRIGFNCIYAQNFSCIDD